MFSSYRSKIDVTDARGNEPEIKIGEMDFDSVSFTYPARSEAPGTISVPCLFCSSSILALRSLNRAMRRERKDLVEFLRHLLRMPSGPSCATSANQFPVNLSIGDKREICAWGEMHRVKFMGELKQYGIGTMSRISIISFFCWLGTFRPRDLLLFVVSAWGWERHDLLACTFMAIIYQNEAYRELRLEEY